MPFYAIPKPSMSREGGRADPVTISTGKQYWNTIATTLRRTGHASHQGSTIELSPYYLYYLMYE